ncbi:MAG: hypothetical protein PHQ36_02790 [Anaerolineales bacterium]|nr:hypothetical protein [Anaerolineales bacterium]
MSRNRILYATLIFLLAAVTSCRNAATQSPKVEASATEAEITSDAYRPLALEECQVISDQVAAALNAKFTLAEKPLADFGLQGSACAMETNGTGANFDLMNSLNAIEGTLTGWALDTKLSAAAPTGMIQGYTNGNVTLLVSISWTPSPDANCPTDQPISACALAPEQKLFTISLLAAQK